MHKCITIFKRSATLAVAMFIVAALAVAAAAPNVRGVSGSGVPVVDGIEAEWNFTTTDASNPDWFAPLCAPPLQGCATPVGDLFMRYDCRTNTLFMLVTTRVGNTYIPDLPLASTFNNYVQFFPVVGNILQDGPPYTTNTSPPMWRDLLDGRGFEAAFNKYGANNLTPGTYNISMDVIANINGVKSGREDMTLVLPCVATAVTVSSISAHTVDDTASWSLMALGAAGLVVLGGLVVVAFRKH